MCRVPSRAPEVELTPEMIEAGAEEFLRWSGGTPMDFGNESDAAESIFRVMVSAAKTGPNPEQPA
jgi:hypothetical protein